MSMGTTPKYVGIEGARRALSEIGIELSSRQIKRAADPDAAGKRKLPFFVDPITGTLKIEVGSLLAVYARCEVQAQNNAHLKGYGAKISLEPRL